MSDNSTSKLADYLVVLNSECRSFTSETDSRWGGLIDPAPDENPGKTGNGLRIVLFGSWEFGYLALETLKRYESLFITGRSRLTRSASCFSNGSLMSFLFVCSGS